MINAIIAVFAIYALVFLIKESSGPWGIISWARNYLMRNKYVGVFFFNLLSCSFCLGCHAGWIIYLLYEKTWECNFLILWGLAGGAISLIIDAALNKLYN